jgi:hypothetical protein
MPRSLATVVNEADMRSHLALKFPKYIEAMSFEKKIADFKIAI